MIPTPETTMERDTMDTSCEACGHPHPWNGKALRNLCPECQGAEDEYQLDAERDRDLHLLTESTR